jgi:hypothetical protein
VLYFVGIARKRNSRFSRLEKGKATKTKPRKPKYWVAPVIEANETAGVLTRAKKTLLSEFQEQAHADVIICDVLAQFPSATDGDLNSAMPEATFKEHDGEMFSPRSPPEVEHSVASIDTCNIDIWNTILADETWRTMTPIRRVIGFGATHPGGSIFQLPATAVDVQSLPDFYVNWNTLRAGWALLVPNRFLSDASFHTGNTPSWTQGDVLGEYTHAITGKKMVLCDLGGYDQRKHMEAKDCRIATGPQERAVGSEGGHGYGWCKRKHCFSPKEPLSFPSEADNSSKQYGRGIGSDDEAPEDPSYENNVIDDDDPIHDTPTAPEPPGEPIQDYEVPATMEGIDGTEDSTARSTFPKVSTSLPEYLVAGTITRRKTGINDYATTTKIVHND